MLSERPGERGILIGSGRPGSLTSPLLLGVLSALLCSSVSPGFAEETTPKKAPPKPAMQDLFDGKSLKDWKITEFGGEGEVHIEEGVMILEQGSEITGIHWQGKPLPKVNYELSVEAKRIDGSDFFCGIVFPHRDAYCSFVVGGWGGGVVGLSSVDGLYAAENDTASFHTFKDDTWYKIRLRVGENYVQAWIDKDQVLDLDVTDRELSLHPAMYLAKPLGISCFATVAGVRKIQWRELDQAERVRVPADKQ